MFDKKNPSCIFALRKGKIPETRPFWPFLLRILIEENPPIFYLKPALSSGDLLLLIGQTKNGLSDPDPLFHETDPRIRIHIKIKRIRNTADCIKEKLIK